MQICIYVEVPARSPGAAQGRGGLPLHLAAGGGEFVVLPLGI